jgi:pyruvate/2-oxoglutarate/acetoin dehydrogenase E1 component
MTATEIITYRDALHRTMRSALADHPGAIILGQGVNDHKGTFGTTNGLADEFGTDRVLDMPLCEEATTGVAVGAALNGLYPIHVHIRADFVLLAMNQIINMAAKYRYMSGGHCSVPMLIRLVVGRSWGQGAQHSQSLQSLFAHIPGLTVVMPANAQSVLDTYAHVVANHRGPVVSLEHRLLYDIQFETGQSETGRSGTGPAAAIGSRKMREGRDITIVATSIMVLEAQRAARHLAEHAGIDCEVIDLHTPSHPDTAMILDSVARTGRLLIADTSWPAYGVGAEICRLVCETDPRLLRQPAVTLGMRPSPCPTAKRLEDFFYPNLTDLTDTVARMVRGPDHGVRLPDERSMADIYKRFKGPF